MVPDWCGKAGDALQLGDTADIARCKTALKLKIVSFLKRKAPTTTLAEAPARKRYRMKSRSWLYRIDNALLEHCGVGLKHFVAPDINASPDVAATWPRLSITADRGPDVVCALNYLQRKLMVNVDYVPDNSHDSYNELKECIKGASLWSHVLVAAVAYNVDHAPWSEVSCVKCSRGCRACRTCTVMCFGLCSR